MRIHFHNSSGVKVQLVIMRYAPDACAGQGDWLVEGWWTINPGDEVFPFTTTNIYSAYYAEDTEGLGKIWGGNYNAYIIYNVFSHCVNIQPPGSKLVGMRLINTGQLYDDYTVTLTP
jgi:hypothetical protein